MLEVHGPTKVPHTNRGVLAAMMRMSEAEIRFIEPDVGGGFGAVYTDEVVPDPAEIAKAVLGAIKGGTERRELRMPEVVVEPGRALTANAAVTLYRVGSVKRTPGGPTFAAVDGGMSDNIRVALYGAKYTAAVANKRARKAKIFTRVMTL